MKYIIVAETGSDISEELAKKYGIYMVPMHVVFGERLRDDGSFLPEEVCDYYEKTGKLPKTSGCNTEDFAKTFKEVFEKYPDSHIVYMAYSAVTTCSYQSAKIAAEDYEHISFIDTKNVTIGQCAAVIRLAQEIEKNPDWAVSEVETAAINIAKSVKMCFIPSNLEYLRAGGRISNATALCGSILSIHPKIEVIDGLLKSTKKYRGKMKKIVLTLMSDYVKEWEFSRDEIWLSSTCGFSESLIEEVINMAYNLGFKKVNWIKNGGVITTHGGPNAFCIAGFSDK
jgi:DegV family protein with EDD domain